MTFPNEIIYKYTPHNEPFDITVDLDKSHGSYIVDKLTGEEYLDCLSYIASAPLGHNHPSLFEEEFTKKLLRVARTKPNNAEFYTEELSEFYHTFVNVAKPRAFKYLFFIESGASAIDNAIKTAIDWKVRLQEPEAVSNVLQNMSIGNDYKIIYLEGAFHGRGGYSTSITNTYNPWQVAFFPKFDWIKLKSHVTQDSVTQLQWYERELNQIPVELLKRSAALILEPIQSVGGDRQFDKEVHKLFRDFTKKHDILLIYDEIQTGVGITGKMWCYQHYDITPDVIVFGKKIQTCGFMATKVLDRVENHAMIFPSRLTSTFSGGLVDMVRCQRYLEVIKEEKLLTNVKQVGDYLQRFLEELVILFPTLVSNPRGLGLLRAFDLPNTAIRNEFIADCFLKSKIILLGCGTRSIRLRPALTFSYEDVVSLYNCIVTILQDKKYTNL